MWALCEWANTYSTSTACTLAELPASQTIVVLVTCAQQHVTLVARHVYAQNGMYHVTPHHINTLSA